MISNRKFTFMVILFMVLIVLVAVSGPSVAQEATPVPMAPPVTIVQPDPNGDTVVTGNEPVTIVHDDSPALLIGLGVMAILLIALSVLWTQDRHRLAEYAREIIPKPVLDELLSHRAVIQADVDTGFNAIDTIAAVTPTTIDDWLSKYSREGVHKIVDAFADALDEQVVAVVSPVPQETTININPPPTASANPQPGISTPAP